MVNINIKKQLSGPNGVMQLDVSMHIAEGSIISIFGPSGSGKTTILRIIAGLQKPDEGAVQVNGPVSFVFQEPVLFPHMNVQGNLCFALRHREDLALVDEWARRMGLMDLKQHYPHQLSGGQAQRVALAMALIRRPKVLLLDEPLTGQDLVLRQSVTDQLLQILKDKKITTVMVSHDINDVMKLSDQIFILNEGKIIKSGNPRSVLVGEHFSGKFKFTGQVVDIIQDGVVFIVTLAIGQHLTRVIATQDEIENLKKGQMVIAASKAFNPLILPI